ncbi:MAG: hypothetical protein FWG21_02270 [Oscillospiraceae bacterium]|nr:hypothetical protein [Oscillospiraceae bacterium]
MKKMSILLALILMLLPVFAACDTAIKVSDGVYRVEMAEFDINGYRDFVEFEIVGGNVISIKADAYNQEDGLLKTDSQEIRSMMEAVSGTYPEKFYLDLVNEYIGSGGTRTDVIAGATMSSENFFYLMKYAENAWKTNDSSVLIVKLDIAE